MNDWQWTQKEHNHGEALGEELEMTTIYLHYNSGRPISTNGQDFSALMEELVLQWPVPVEELHMVTHSMGGLVTRSAMHYAQQEKKTWIKQLNKVVFLGTPHHGAALEQAGNYLDVILESIPYAKPLARLGKIRSAGVMDLRYGNLVEEDWKELDRYKINGDQRQHIPLPKVNCYAIAAVIGKKDTIANRLLGDKLVSVKSALGQHKIPAKNLKFKKKNTWIAFGNKHLDLLSSSEVYDKLKGWLGE